MKRSTLLQLFYGDIRPFEQYHPTMEEYKQMSREHCSHYKDFCEKLRCLEPPLHESFVKIMNQQYKELPLQHAQMFIEGFRLGAKMMIDVYQNEYSDEDKE